MERYISCSGHKIAEEAKKWVGYLEHNDNKLIGLPKENVGKGGHTVFAEIVRQKAGRNLQGLPWCAVFVYAVILNILGKEDTKLLIGRPHARARNLSWAAKRRRLWHTRFEDAQVGDIIFLSNDGKHIDHCGIIVDTDGIEYLTTVEGNAVDDSGHFEKEYGGAVSLKRRHCNDWKIIGYGSVTRRFKNGDL